MIVWVGFGGVFERAQEVDALSKEGFSDRAIASDGSGREEG